MFLLLILPCIIPLFLQALRRMIESTVKATIARKLLLMYKRLPTEDQAIGDDLFAP